MESILARTPVQGAVTFIVQDGSVQQLAQDLPLLSGKRAGQSTTAYVCERGRCSLPARDEVALKKQLDAL
jgi:uncharacterized protein YyaL (SSP411 family)